jgi:hypothetical protein
MMAKLGVMTPHKELVCDSKHKWNSAWTTLSITMLPLY